MTLEVRIVEVYEIRVSSKEAELLRIVFEHEDRYMRENAMEELEKIAGPETLEYIVMNHQYRYMRDWAMKVLKNL